MKLRQLQLMTWAFMAGVLVAAGVCVAMGLGRPAVTHPATGRLLMIALGAMAVADLGVAVWLFLTNWQPLCESSLKRVWAGRFSNVAEARTVTQQLAVRGVVIMALTVSPALYAAVLAMLGAASPATLGTFIGASLLGLLLFLWYGLQPVAGLFEHVERIARS